MKKALIIVLALSVWWVTPALAWDPYGQQPQENNGYNGLLPPYQHDAYGPGIHSDGSGRPFTYQARDGKTLSPIFQGDVKRDGYGPGVHTDRFGRLVYDRPLQ